MKVRVKIESDIATSDCTYDFKNAEFFKSRILLERVTIQIDTLREMHKDHAEIMSEIENEAE